MKITGTDGRIRISDLEELGMGTALSIEAQVSAALPERVKDIEIDLSRTRLVDCSGVGVLMNLRKSARARCAEATVRLVNPPGAARRLFQVAGVDQLFVTQDGSSSLLPATTQQLPLEAPEAAGRRMGNV